MISAKKKGGEVGEALHILFHLPLICKPRYFAFLPVTKDEPFLILKVSPSVCILYLNFFSLKEIILALIPLSTSSVLHSPLDHFHQHIYMLCNIYHIKKKILPLTLHPPQGIVLSIFLPLPFTVKLPKRVL